MLNVFEEERLTLPFALAYCDLQNFSEKGDAEVTAYRKHIGDLFTGSKQLKASKFLLDLDKL